MQLKSLQLQQFRCFREIEFHFQPGINLIEGPNGSGKTSLLEALHYLCYLRSFRTFFTRELIQVGQPGFFARAAFGPPAGHDDPAAGVATALQIGFSPQKRLIKIAQREVQTYRELLALYTALSFVEDDLELIKGEPNLRRNFLDQFIALYTPNYLGLMSEYKRNLVNRNALIQRLARTGHSTVTGEYQVWTEQLQAKAAPLQAQREQALHSLQQTVNALLLQYFPTTQLQVALQYHPKALNLATSELLAAELRWKRSLFGAHLDDFTISLAALPSRAFASRGQQKLILTLLKLAQQIQLQQLNGHAITPNFTPPACLLLLDDFMTDLDQRWLQILVQALQELKHCQLIFTAPSQQQSALRTILQQYPVHVLQLS